MSLRRIGVLLGKELVHGPKNFIFIWIVIAPVLISLLFGLIFGSLISEKPKLGILDEGNSQLVSLALGLDSITAREYETVDELKEAAESGAVDMGIVLPAGFDATIQGGGTAQLDAYVWGESLAKNRATLPVTIADIVRSISGQEVPVEIESIIVGEAESLPWSDRLLPFLVLMAVFLGGLLLPSTSIIEERQKKTLDALTVTPTTIGDVFISKGILAVVLSMATATIILLINQAFGVEPLLLTLVLFLGAVMAAAIGLIFGAIIRDITTLFAIWKGGGILLFAPAIVYMFPQIPEWVARIFPTYWAIQPVVAITQRGGGWPDIALSVFVLTGLIAALIGLNIYTLRRRRLVAG